MELDQIGGKVIKKITAWATFIIVESFQGYINVDTLPKKLEKFQNDETLPKNWKSYHKMKIIPVDFRRFPTPAEAKRIICQQSSEKQIF